MNKRHLKKNRQSVNLSDASPLDIPTLAAGAPAHQLEIVLIHVILRGAGALVHQVKRTNS